MGRILIKSCHFNPACGFAMQEGYFKASFVKGDQVEMCLILMNVQYGISTELIVVLIKWLQNVCLVC